LNFPKDYYKTLTEKYEGLRQTLFNTLRSTGFKAQKPAGAYYIIADYSDLLKILPAKTDFDFAIKLLEKTGVATVPGSSFYSKGENTHLVRFAFCKKNETLRSVDRLLIEKLR
jgi:aspartate/methionine/tyrosine aminotransferase